MPAEMRNHRNEPLASSSPSPLTGEGRGEGESARFSPLPTPVGKGELEGDSSSEHWRPGIPLRLPLPRSREQEGESCHTPHPNPGSSPGQALLPQGENEKENGHHVLRPSSHQGKESSRSSNTTVTIVGAGLAGPLAALLLARQGWRVTVIERRGDPRTAGFAGGRSINLALAARGLRALAAGGLEDAVQPLLIPMRGRMTHTRDGDIQLLSYGQRPEEVIHSVSREGLNLLLIEAAAATGRVEFRFGCALNDFDPAGETLTFDSAGKPEKIHLHGPVIGADGAGSALRRALVERGIIEASEDMLDHAYKELSIPADNGGAHQLEREALHIWPRGGYMLIALPNTDGSFTVTLFLAREGEPGFAALTTPEAVDKFFAREFPDAHALMPDLANEFFANPTGALGTVYAEPWHAAGKALLIGDAAHAIVPFHGQGMNAAFEDCRLLAERLAPDADIAEVFAGFSREHKPDTDALARMALENYIEMRDSVRDPGFALRKELGFELERRQPDRFVPRYSMVMFHHLPYAEAEWRGAIQHDLLMRFTKGKTRLDNVDIAAAEHAVVTSLLPLPSGEGRGEDNSTRKPVPNSPRQSSGRT